jgi:uncharacterized protein (DUF3820 family)
MSKQYDNQWNKSSYEAIPDSGRHGASWFHKIPCGKYEGRVWADIIKEDSEYVKDIAEKRYIHNLYVPEMKYPKGSEFYMWIVQNLKIDVPENIPFGQAKERNRLLKQDKRQKALQLVMPFGVHKGKKLSQIENSYLEWVLNNIQDDKWKFLTDACQAILGRKINRSV